MNARSRSLLNKFASIAAESYGADLHRFLARRFNKRDEIQDLVQEVYVRLLAVDRGEFVRNPKAYILQTAANVLKRYAQRDRRSQACVIFDSDVVEQASEHPVEIRPCKLAQRLSTQAQLTTALMQLTPIHAAVLLLFYRDGYSYEEIATRINVSPRQVKRYVANAKQELMDVDWKWE